MCALESSGLRSELSLNLLSGVPALLCGVCVGLFRVELLNPQVGGWSDVTLISIVKHRKDLVLISVVH